ncbi:DUF4124 domain-containing protein [Usitatibacter palustris]|uniref:DUF4124 domain-containing protein n=1 Tax=Usitatibacter palustris TaxID=2732487 RepID=A0A6M4HDZ2_9PROT|nr:DUF4124 domain-containing protein [Usitatibacter palustris]QJR16834.1 hypothetical protein DSM104440_03670 [Usitatibacter palustris]
MRGLIVLLAAFAASTAGAAYRCVDEKGVTHIGDTPPAACAKVPMFEVSRSGTVLRKIDPTPTAEEAKSREEAAAKAKEEAKHAFEQRRKDIALLATYSAEKDFDIATERNTEPIQGRIAMVQERQKAVDKRLKEIEEEMEFYKAGKSKASSNSKVPAKTREIPIQLQTDHERTLGEQAHLKKNLAEYEKELADVKAKYDADRKRWKELKTNSTLRSQVNAPTKEDQEKLKNWTRGQAVCGEKTISCRRGESYLCLSKDGTWHSVPCEAPKL